MSQNKTVFQFQVNSNMAAVDNTIRNWLAANEFKFQPKPNANYYAYNDPWVKGKRGFEYYINNNIVTILAYVGTFENPMELEGLVGAMGKQAYRNELEPLVQEIKRIESEGAPAMQAVPQQAVQTNAPQPGQAMQPQPQPMQQPQPGGNVNTFIEENMKKKENLVILGFVLSIIGVLISCVGVSFGAILIILEFYCGVQGLKTRKKGMAIATIVLASINILILIMSIVLTIFMA